MKAKKMSLMSEYASGGDLTGVTRQNNKGADNADIENSLKAAMFGPEDGEKAAGAYSQCAGEAADPRLHLHLSKLQTSSFDGNKSSRRQHIHSKSSMSARRHYVNSKEAGAEQLLGDGDLNAASNNKVAHSCHDSRGGSQQDLNDRMNDYSMQDPDDFQAQIDRMPRELSQMSEKQDHSSARRRKVGQSGGGANSNKGSRSKRPKNSGRSKKVGDQDVDLEAVGEIGVPVPSSMKKNKSVPKKNKVKPIKVD